MQHEILDLDIAQCADVVRHVRQGRRYIPVSLTGWAGLTEVLHEFTTSWSG